MSSVTVKIPTPLRPMTAGQSEVKIEGATVGEVLLKMDSQFKGFGDRIIIAIAQQISAPSKPPDSMATTGVFSRTSSSASTGSKSYFP